MRAPMRTKILPEPVCLLVLCAAWLGFAFVSIVLCGAGFLHPESYSFLPHYLSGAPLLDLIYDNRITDWGNYQARELGFIFDWLDCQFIAWSVQRGHPHFFSATHYGFLLLAGVALWRIGTRHLGLDRLVAFGLVLLLWTCPTAMLYTSFYRAAKVSLLLTTLLVVWAWLNARAHRDGGRGWFHVALFGLLAALLPMFDKQGLLFLGAAVLLLARNAIVQRTACDRRLLVAGLLALAFAWSYQRFIGPAITLHLLGYEVNRGYTAIPFADLASDPRFLGTVALGAPLLAFDSFRIPLGNLPAGLALLAVWWMWRQFAAMPAAGPQWLSPAALFAGLILFVCAVYAAMLMLFPLLLSSEHRRFFYCLPVAAFWLVAVAVALGESARRSPERRRWLALAVGALVVGNVFALQEHRFVLRHGHYEPFGKNAALVREALRPASIAAAGITPSEAAALLGQAPYFRDAVPPSLREDRIYLSLLARSREASRSGGVPPPTPTSRNAPFFPTCAHGKFALRGLGRGRDAPAP